MNSHPPPVTLYSFQFVTSKDNTKLGGNCTGQVYIMRREPASDKPGQVSDLVEFSGTLDYTNPYGGTTTFGRYPNSKSADLTIFGATWTAAGITALRLSFQSDQGVNFVLTESSIYAPQAEALWNGSWVFLDSHTVKYPVPKVPGT